MYICEGAIVWCMQWSHWLGYSVDWTINTVVKIGSVCVRTKGRPFHNDRAVIRYVFLHL